MCGRFASFLPAEAMARIFGTTNPLPNFAPSWNVAPINDVAVVRRHPETGPTRAQRPINARSETAATSGMFKRALAQRRCLVPADAFYEWKVPAGGEQPYAIARKGQIGQSVGVDAHKDITMARAAHIEPQPGRFDHGLRSRARCCFWPLTVRFRF